MCDNEIDNKNDVVIGTVITSVQDDIHINFNEYCDPVDVFPLLQPHPINEIYNAEICKLVCCTIALIFSFTCVVIADAHEWYM